VFSPDLARGPDIFDHRGVDRARGAMVIVRPDQYVAGVLPMTSTDTLSRFFERLV
jgi:phenol 2-monooxygenase